MDPCSCVRPDPSVPAKSADSAIQIPCKNLSNLNLAWLLEPQLSRSKFFFEAMAARIEAPQRGSTRSVYEAKLAMFTKWCQSIRSAIPDKLGDSPINVSYDQNITRLLDSFHRDKPKCGRGIPPLDPFSGYSPAHKGSL